MSTATAILDALAEAVTLSPAEAAVIEHGREVLADVDDDFWYPCGEGGRADIRYSREGLREALAEHAGLLDGSRHPASVFDDLSDHRDDALGIALQRVTEDVAAWAGDLVTVIREHAGNEAYNRVSGSEGGEQ